jgi:hypothetical protein
LKNAVSYYKRNSYYKRKNQDPTVESTPPTASNTTIPFETNSKSSAQTKGRPNKTSLRSTQIAYSAATNEVTQMAAELKKKEGILTSASFGRIVTEVRKKRNLPEEFEIKKVQSTREFCEVK